MAREDRLELVILKETVSAKDHVTLWVLQQRNYIMGTALSETYLNN